MGCGCGKSSSGGIDPYSKIRNISASTGLSEAAARQWSEDQEEEASQKKGPSIFQKAKNLASAAVGVVADAREGRPIKAKPEVSERRLKICAGGIVDGKGVPRCPSYHPPFCGECGCQLEVKVLISSSACPLGKW